MLIFSLLDTPAFGGAEQYLTQGLSFLAHQGYSVVLATNNDTVRREVALRNKKIGLAANQFEIIDAPYVLDAIGNWKGLLKFLVGLPGALWWCYHTLRQLSQRDQVLCLWPGFSDRLALSPVAKWLKLPLIWIEFGPLEPTFRKNWGFPKLLYRLTQHLPDHFITTSKFTRQSMITTGQISPRKISLVYPGAPIWTATQRNKTKQQGLRQLQQHKLTGQKLITYLGRLASENQVELVIEAFAQIMRKAKISSQYKLLLIGDGPERQKYQQLVADLGLSDQVIWTGFVSEEVKHAWLAVSTVFIFPRTWVLEGFGMTTIEAMSAGVPVITTDFGPQREIVTNGVNGLRFRPHDSKDLAKKLQYLLERPKLQQKMAKEATQNVQDFSVYNMQQRTLAIIQQFSPSNQ